MLFSFCHHLASVVCCPLTFHILSSHLKSDNKMNPNLFNIWIIIINYGLECEKGKSKGATLGLTFSSQKRGLQSF